MFFDEKQGPHFHAVYAESKASIDIESGKIFAGKLPKRAQRIVLEWTKLHRAELLENWERARRDEPLQAIEPLK